ncbi:protein lethal(2)essential for life-like [Prorops nasuta]|uniref:protein lethal(2)essential for life-like n=1 Tax=Prorops nasuta TaxID=863751 RepID=UPI0034CD1594
MRSRMSIVPRLVSHWWETLDRPHRLIDQHFGSAMDPERLFNQVERRINQLNQPFYSMFPYHRPWADLMREEDSGWSVVKNEDDKFVVSLDVQQFKPEEVNVKVVDNYIIIEGKHEEKQDDHGIISRHFVRKYLVPEQCNPEMATSTLSSDGVLTISTPRKPEALENKKEKPIKIEHTGKPALENQDEEKKRAVN